jgi:hypothetical protein
MKITVKAEVKTRTLLPQGQLTRSRRPAEFARGRSEQRLLFGRPRSVALAHSLSKISFSKSAK